MANELGYISWILKPEQRNLLCFFGIVVKSQMGKSAVTPFRLEHHFNSLVVVFVKYGDVIASGMVL